MRIVAAIPARLNSTRLPKKLLRKICGKTLIVRTYEATVNSNLFDDVLVITNSHEIVSELENSKVKYIFDDANYQTGTDRIAGVASKIEADIIINVQGDEPFINPKDIVNLNNNIISKNSDIGTLGNKITKVDFIDKSIVKVITKDSIEKKRISRAKKFLRKCKNLKKNVYGHIGIYQFRTSTLKKFVNLRQSKNEIKHSLEQLRAIENGINIDVVYSKNKSFGIDTVEDLSLIHI